MGNISLFDWITAYKNGHPDTPWYEINDMLRRSATKPEGYRWFGSGEALRSWYRREKMKHKPNQTLADIFNNLNESFANVANAFGSALVTNIDNGISDHALLTLPATLPETFDPVLQLEMKPTLIMADLHCPYQDNDAIQRALMENIPEQIIIAGDLFDFASVSRFSKSEQPSRLESDLETAGKVLLYLAQFAPLTIISGNHDERLVSKLDTALRFSRVVSMALDGRVPDNEIIVSDYDYCFLGDKYVIGHLSEYSKDPGKVAAKIASKYQKHCLVGHDHIKGYVLSGKLIGASIGSMTDSNKHWYAVRRLNTFPKWETGFAFIDLSGLKLYDGSGDIYFERIVTDTEEWNKCKV